jgi:glycerol-3-phosphate acyltransferase PlsY
VFVVVFALGRFVSLASILGTAAFPFVAWFAAPWVRNYMVMGVVLLVVVLILVKHSQNVQRLLAGTEYRFGSGRKAPPANEAKGSA